MAFPLVAVPYLIGAAAGAFTAWACSTSKEDLKKETKRADEAYDNGFKDGKTEGFKTSKEMLGWNAIHSKLNNEFGYDIEGFEFGESAKQLFIKNMGEMSLLISEHIFDKYDDPDEASRVFESIVSSSANGLFEDVNAKNLNVKIIAFVSKVKIELENRN